MRPVERGDRPKDDSGNEVQYNYYQNARGELINRLGEYCSYCEMHIDSSLAVEHVQPQNPNGNNIPERELEWNNFLLACTNCNSTKGDEDVILNDYLWPHRDNTFYAFKYSEGGLISPQEHLSPELKRKAESTIHLTGLDKHPLNNQRASDRRLPNRREAWDIANLSKIDLRDCDTPQMRRQIVRTATGHGYWSVWMTVFNDDPDMLSRFIDAFPGTHKNSFDSANDYKPVLRAGGLC